MNVHQFEAPLPTESYWSESWLGRERDHVFTNNWIFAGFTQDLAKHNDYLSFTVAGVPVIIRNMKDKLVAFRNICSHRYSIIHPVGCGNAMFRCPYHGWTYDAEGVPIGIPDNARSFGFDKEAKRKLALDPVALETCGRFIFVRLAAEGPSLRNWLGSLAEKLENLSTVFDQVYARRNEVWACNWKLAIDITLEDYHHPLVHPKSYYNHLGRAGPSETETAPPTEVIEGDVEASIIKADFEYAGPHSHSVGPLSERTRQHLESVARRLKLPRSTMLTKYNHFFIYPNLSVSSDDGINCYVARYEPIGGEQTRFDGWLATGTPADPKLVGGIVWQTVTKHWEEYSFSIVGEDRGACEVTQLGVRQAYRQGILGYWEDRIKHFQATLLKETGSNRIAA
jgi:phenylpropionate dioxygenase-like ring-hydroxylating dioxygenase large terminal subunit